MKCTKSFKRPKDPFQHVLYIAIRSNDYDIISPSLYLTIDYKQLLIKM